MNSIPSRMAPLAVAVTVFLAMVAQGQIQVLSERARLQAGQALESAIKAHEDTPLGAHLRRARASGGAGAVLASRVARDFPGIGDTVFAHYAVPPMSNVQRLPGNYPLDGQAGRPVRIYAAKGEYEPGSFLVYPFQDLGKVSFTLSPFVTKDGKTFPADHLDLKVVKVWYQNKNAWYSYFGDCGFKLVPELLLNDEDLIRVDEEKKANYARLTGPDGSIREKWINSPRKMNMRFEESRRGFDTFMPMRPDFRDAETLRPVMLKEGSFRNLFLTVHASRGMEEGLYRGAVRLADAKGARLGEIPVEIRVLPFELPAPRSYVNPEQEFLVASYSYFTLHRIMKENGGDRELAIRQREAIMRNLLRHNENVYWLGGGLAEQKLAFEQMKKTGMRTDIVIASPPPQVSSKSQGEMEADARAYGRFLDQTIGHHNVFIGYGDEPSAAMIARERPLLEAYQKAGLKFILAGSDGIYYKAGYLYDWHNVGKDPTDPSSVRLWNQLGHAHVAWYARMHVGPENPAYNRMQYGMAPYLSGYSAVCNWAHHLGPYDDDSATYRPMVFAYGIYDGLLDTLQWEGFREGIDDIRYATLMTSLARKASKSEAQSVRYAGLKALQYLANFDYSHGGDLNANRLEMIRHILLLRNLLAM